jgi:hypothetical protein
MPGAGGDIHEGMKVALTAFGLLALTGCVRATEGLVREHAATAFSCADYALHVEEVAPDVFRASGCGQELIYACRPATVQHTRAAAEPAEPDEVADMASETPMECARRPE